MRVQSVLQLLASAVVPPTCAGCGLPGPTPCAVCAQALRPIVPPLCGGCGHPWAVPVGRCAQCRGRIEGGRAALHHEGPAERIVIALKDRRRRALAAVMAELIVVHTPRPPAGTVLVPIPLSAKRQTRRGFNQSAALAAALSEAWALPLDDVLVRVGEERSQRGAGLHARVAQVRGAFRVRSGAVARRPVCLVDDVHTTGATLASAAHALWSHGVRKITTRSFTRVSRSG